MVGGEGYEINMKSKVDLSRMPPPQMCLYPNITRTNYRLRGWKRSHENMPEVPSPVEHGWVQNPDSHVLEPLWSSGPVLPERLIDLLPSDNMNDSAESDEEEDWVEPDVDSDDDHEL